MLQRIGPRILVIVPGDREDVIARDRPCARRIGREAGGDALGLVLTGGYRPRAPVARGDPGAPTCSRRIVAEDTYAVASEVHDLLVKTHAADSGKIEEIKALVWEHLFIDRILEVAAEASRGLIRRPRVGVADPGAGAGPEPRPAPSPVWYSPNTPPATARFPGTVGRAARCRSAGSTRTGPRADSERRARRRRSSSAQRATVGDRHVVDLGERLRGEDVAASSRAAPRPSARRRPMRRSGREERPVEHRCRGPLLRREMDVA